MGDIVWYFAKRQVAKKPPKLTQKWTGLYRVSQVFNKICLEMTAVADPRNIVRTTIHYVTAYKGADTLHHSIERPDQLVLPCPDTEEDIDFQEVEPAAASAGPSADPAAAPVTEPFHVPLPSDDA